MASVETTSLLENAGEAAANQARVAPRISHAVLLTVSQIARRLLRLIFLLLVARALGPDRFGVYALLLVLVEFVSTFSGAGFVDYLTRETAKNNKVGWGLGAQLALLRCFYLMLVGAAGIGLLWLLKYPSPVLMGGACLLLTLFPRALSESVQAVLRGLQRYVLFLTIELVLGLTLVAGACVVIVRSSGLGTVIIAEIVAAVAAGLVALILLVDFWRPGWVRIEWAELANRTFVFNVYPVLGNLYNRLDVVILSNFAGNLAVGIYSVAYRAVEMLQLISSGVLYSLLPSLSGRTWEETEEQRLEKAMGLLFMIALGGVLATEVFAAPMVRLLLGARYAESVPAARILIWAIVPMYMNFSFNIVLLARDRERVFLMTSSVCLAVNLIANLLLIPYFSWKAAAAVTIVTECVLLLQNGYWMRRVIGNIPRPHGVLRTSLAFAALLATTELGARTAFQLPVGTACFLLFLTYFYRSSLVVEFLTAWRSRRLAAA